MNHRIRTIVRIVLFVGTAISMFYVPWPIIRTWIQPLPDTVQEQINDATNHGFDGMIVYVDQGGKEPAFYAAGWKNKENKVPADPHALFKIASVSKLYHAVAITKLVSSNKLSLDGTLADYFPELVGRVEYADQITLRMMVQHRSGLPNFTDTPDYWTYPAESSEAALALIYDMPAEFAPGESYMYCNTNYLLLSMLIEKVSGMTTFEYIKEVILNPLGLTHTYGSIHEVNMDDVMSGYYIGVERDIKTEDYGSMLATPEDVGKFIRALNDGSVFNAGEKEIYSSIYEYGHGGLIPGYMTYAYYHQDIDAVVVQMINTTDFNGYEWNIHQIIYNRIVKIIRNNTSSIQ